MENNVNKIYLSMESFRRLSNAWMEIDYPLKCDGIEWIEIRNIIKEYGCFIRKLICEYFSKLEFDEEDLKGLQNFAAIFDRLQRDRKTLHIL